jgi:hypothetical protein
MLTTSTEPAFVLPTTGTAYVLPIFASSAYFLYFIFEIASEIATRGDSCALQINYHFLFAFFLIGPNKFRVV